MKLSILQAPSPNFNERLFPLDMLVLHYTGMKDGPSALEKMRDPASNVSAHYMVEEDGRIFQLVAEDKRAWQAGKSWWRGDDDLNSRSIGIEIVNGGHDFGLPPFADIQIAAVIDLCESIVQRWRIPQTRIVAHSDIAPERKEDPGERFPWKRLADAGIGLWPADRPPVEPWMTHGAGKGDKGITVDGLREALATIGYKVERAGEFDEALAAVVRAFQRRWIPLKVTGHGDVDTIARAQAVALLTQAGDLQA